MRKLSVLLPFLLLCHDNLQAVPVSGEVRQSALSNAVSSARVTLLHD